MSGWQFWPDHEGSRHDAAQTDWIRPYRPGVIRVFVAAALALTTGVVAGVGLLAGWSQPTWSGRVIGVVGALLAAGTLGWLAGRVYAAGVWVNDRGVRLLGIVERRTMPWTAVVDVAELRPTRLLGLPIVVPGRTVWIHRNDGTVLRTGLTSASPDFLGRPEPYAQAAGAVRRWWLECR